MENKGLIFIPDISGFTKFVNETEIGHSRLIIQELLEILVNANNTGLAVSEIEGDAILFYKFGEAPELAELYKQVEKMFCDFHRSLVAYEMSRFCQCNACTSAIDLTLKVICHYGEFTGYSVKDFHKLIGKDIIVAHQLLKNDVDHHEYWLVTESLLKDKPPDDLEHWMKWNTSAKTTGSGDILFHYTQLSQLKSGLTPEPYPQPDLSKKVKVLSISKAYETDIITLFHGSADLKYRGRWLEGVKAVEEINHFLPRVGMRCRCVMETGEVLIYASSYSYSPEKIEFSETDEKNQNLSYYTLEKTSGSKTLLTLEIYLQKTLTSQMIFNLFQKKKTEERFHKSLKNLEKLVSGIKIPAQTLS